MMDSLVIRDIDGAAQLHAVRELQEEVWSLPDLEVGPLSHLVAAKRRVCFARRIYLNEITAKTI
jgi:hypothetical protein